MARREPMSLQRRHVLLAATGIPWGARAHHGWSSFDPDRPIYREGTVRKVRWEVELAPLTRMQAWQVQEIKPGTAVSVVGFTLREEKGDAVLRAEYLFVDGKAYGLRSSPA